MSYSYGTQGAPVVGGGAPGLPTRKQADQSTYTRIVSGSGVLIPPQGAKFMRVAVIGGGAPGWYDTSSWVMSGAGGGCAATKAIPAAPITYSIGVGGTAVNNLSFTNSATDTVASLPGYKLTGPRGGNASAPETPNIGLGGDYNFSGGAGSAGLGGTRGGGGAAGPNGDGGAGSDGTSSPKAGSPGVFSGSGWGVGGGAGGCTAGSSPVGGAGTGGLSATGSNARKAESGTPFGLSTIAQDGGEMGGGGGCVSTAFGNGGSGGMVVEWFY